ncbi:MAG: peptidylprolyl isomerase [Clostridiales bacterium]|jgi:parvulin-like peptidyl-prolyl isomerase|nr:peptidylprolyl isomerase [Clostridiales bacterium]
MQKTLVILFFAAAGLLLAGCSSDQPDGGATAPAAQVSEASRTEAAATAPASAEAETTTVLIEEIPEDLSALQLVKAGAAGGDFSDSEPPVAELAEQRISQHEFRYLLNSYKSDQLLNTGITRGEAEERNFWTQVTSGGKTRIDEAREIVLKELQNLKVCNAVAQKRGLVLDEDELENLSTDISAKIDRFGGQEGFEELLLDEYGVTLAEYARINAQFALRQKLFEAVEAGIAVPEDEIRAAYDGDRDRYGGAATVRHILFLYEGGENQRSNEATRALADKMLEKVRAGEDMAGLALEYSEDPAAAENEGEYSLTRADDFVPEFIEWAFSAKTGDTGVVETSYGCHVMRLEARADTDLEGAREKIEAELRRRGLASQLGEWMEDSEYAMTVNEAVYGSIS